jgi:hypothetical protein
MQLEVDGKHFLGPCDIADEFSKHFQSVYNYPCPVTFLTLSLSSEFLSLALFLLRMRLNLLSARDQLNLLQLMISLALLLRDVLIYFSVAFSKHY